MAENSFGVIVDKYDSSFGVWLLFRGTDAYLSALDPRVCNDPLRVGDIVQASTTNNEPRIRRAWPFPESVCTEGDKVVARSIVSYDNEISSNRNIWTDEETGYTSILLVSRDLGIVQTSSQWYHHEFSEAGQSHVLVYLEYHPRKLKNLSTDELIDINWTIIDTRISLPVIPSKDENPSEFLVADKIHKVPVLIMIIQGNSMLGWSYALGDRMVITPADEDFEIGQWVIATVVRSSRREVESHGCTYTALTKEPAQAFSLPDIKVDRGKISMTLTLSRTERRVDNAEVEIRLFHDYWGLHIKYNRERAEWIQGDSSTLRAIVEVVITGDDDFEGRRVNIMAVGPATMPRTVKSLPPPVDPPSGFNHTDDLKKTLVEVERRDKEEVEWVLPPIEVNTPERSESRQSRRSTENTWVNSNNNNESEEWCTQSADQTRAKAYKSDDGWKEEKKERKKEEATRVVSPDERRLLWKDLPMRGLVQNTSVTSSKKNTLGLPKNNGGAAKEDLKPKVQNSGQGKVWADNDNDEVDAPPMRECNDKGLEKKWKLHMSDLGWKMPVETEMRQIPIGEDGWQVRRNQNFRNAPLPDPPPMPVEVLIKKPNFMRDAMNLKSKKCLITKVKYNGDWSEAELIELFILEDTPQLMYHRCGKDSYLKNLPFYTTVGNVVEVHVKKRYEGYYVYDEMWRATRGLELPMKEIIEDRPRIKKLQVIVTANCFSPESQRFNNENVGLEQSFTLLTDDYLNKVVYYGKSIDATKYEDYNFQMIVETRDCPEVQACWVATAVLWMVTKDILDSFGPPPSNPRPPLPRARSPPPRPPVIVDFNSTVDHMAHYNRAAYMPAAPDSRAIIPREERLLKVLDLYKKLLEKEELLQALATQTGNDYKAKLIGFVEVIETSMPHSGSMRKELQLNADFLKSIVENDYCYGIFLDMKEKAIWKVLFNLENNLKAFRTPVFNR
ncbi:hypothetical protein PMAYCL1PPCAC_31526 [Pristionchus mayeri]|uniref:Uncharacterized protein n=1 Tax=Pristionchus mayeri TaxID=1317129 RepID=A0AAN5DE47_9BILA|nr:hypothetical protein PMAYCL1PPCAC_31526 [Pristionchus mayeri]